MEKSSLTINGTPLEFGHAWVHMQDADGKDTVHYCAAVQKPSCIDVFDPHKSKQDDHSWKDFLMEQVDELGTFILGAYFENMAKTVENETSVYQWVIATLDDVLENEETIELHGQAVIFDPKRV